MTLITPVTVDGYFSCVIIGASVIFPARFLPGLKPVRIYPTNTCQLIQAAFFARERSSRLSLFDYSEPDQHWIQVRSRTRNPQRLRSWYHSIHLTRSFISQFYGRAGDALLQLPCVWRVWVCSHPQLVTIPASRRSLTSIRIWCFRSVSAVQIFQASLVCAVVSAIPSMTS